MPPRYSQGTKDILDGLMNETKLNPVRQRELRQVMEHGRAAGSKPVRKVTNRRDVPFEDPLRGIALNPNLVYGHSKKTQPQIVAANDHYRRQQFAGGGRVINREAEKQRLQNINAYGSELGQAPPAVASTVTAGRPPKPRSGPAELHAEISAEIEERQAFVQQMCAAGNRAHEAAMQQQIGERLGELHVVEKHTQGS